MAILPSWIHIILLVTTYNGYIKIQFVFLGTIGLLIAKFILIKCFFAK